jgi:hypothetical protein
MQGRARWNPLQLKELFMKHLISTHSLAAAVLVLGTFAAASSAHARSDVSFSIGVQVPGVYVQPAPVYVQPRPTYYPAPDHYRHKGDGRRHEVQHWQRGGYYGDNFRGGVSQIHDSGRPGNQWRQTRMYGPYGDFDRDGITNRRDSDRDGDGVRNRNDRRPDNPYRR